MNEFLVFGGTTEGRLLAQYCNNNGISCVVSVATEYGAELLPRSDYVRAEIGRKNRDKIAGFILSGGFSAVFDATHPYAEEAGKNISGACSDTGTPYYRVIREPSPVCSEAVYLDSAVLAVRYAEKSLGDIFIATGSKELPLFCIGDLPARCVVRVLPDEKIIHECEKAGFKKVISGKGPFSYEDNLAHFKGCHMIITKESGAAGGFEEKRRAAAELGARLIIIRRPEEKGIPLSSAYKLLSELSGKNLGKE